MRGGELATGGVFIFARPIIHGQDAWEVGIRRCRPLCDGHAIIWCEVTWQCAKLDTLGRKSARLGWVSGQRTWGGVLLGTLEP
jgi:hypothetical protein